MIRRSALATALLLGGCSVAPMPAATPRPIMADPHSPAAAEAVVRRFLMRAAGGNAAAALIDWKGEAAAGRAAVDAITRYGAAPIDVSSATDADAGAGQRFVTVPFRIGPARGRAVLHRVAEGIEADDPRVHDWGIRSIAMPTAGCGHPTTIVARHVFAASQRRFPARLWPLLVHPNVRNRGLPATDRKT